VSSSGDDMCSMQSGTTCDITDKRWLYTAAAFRYSCSYIPIHGSSPPIGQY